MIMNFLAVKAGRIIRPFYEEIISMDSGRGNGGTLYKYAIARQIDGPLYRAGEVDRSYWNIFFNISLVFGAGTEKEA
jgi:hypothetical protein